MKITTETTVLEGTPDELAEYQKRLVAPPITAAGPISLAPENFEAIEEAGAGRQFVSLDVARRVLNRIPLSKEQRDVLVTLYAAHPRRVSGSELQNVVRYTARQLAGLMGAFGRRLAHTPGRQSHEHFFDWERVDGGWEYGLPDAVRRALEIEKIV